MADYIYFGRFLFTELNQHICSFLPIPISINIKYCPAVLRTLAIIYITLCYFYCMYCCSLCLAYLHSRAFGIFIPKKCSIKFFAQNVIYRPSRRYSKQHYLKFFDSHSKFSPNEIFSRLKFQNCRRELANSSFDWKFYTE